MPQLDRSPSPLARGMLLAALGLASLCGCGWRDSLLRFAQRPDQRPPSETVSRSDSLERAAAERHASPARTETASVPARGGSPLERLLSVSVAETDAHGLPLRDQHRLERFNTGWRLEENRPGPYRWTHPGLERWNSLPVDRRPDLRPALDSDDPAVAATAAIGLARSQGAQYLPLLVEIVDPFVVETARGAPRRVHDTAIRRAAMETLGSLEDPRVPAVLGDLLAACAPGGLDNPNPAYSPELHIELLGALARHVSPARDGRFTASLRAPSGDVRTAALRLIVADRSAPLPPPAMEQLLHGPPPMRLAATQALGERRDPDYVPQLVAAAYDNDHSVRLAAIEALGRTGDADAVRALRELLDEGDTRVREADALALRAAGGFDSVRLADGGRKPRDAAQFGSPAEQPDADRVVAASYAEAAAGAKTAAIRPDLLAALHSGLPAVRRSALERIAQFAARHPLPDDTWMELALVASRERDPANWSRLLAVVENAERNAANADVLDTEAASSVLYGALREPTVEVPVTACRLLAGHGSPAHARRLLPLLDSPSPALVVASLETIAVCGPLAPVELAAVERLLQAPNHLLRVEAALALSRLGAASGPAALERLTFEQDRDVRRAAVVAMGELRDPLFLDLLIAQLDERNDDSLRRAVLAVLPRVVGQDVAAPNDTAAAAERREEQWRQWYASGGRSATASPTARVTDS